MEKNRKPRKDPMYKNILIVSDECDVQISGGQISWLVNDVGIIWENKARSLPHPRYQMKFKISISL